MFAQFFTSIGALLVGFFPLTFSAPIVAENPPLSPETREVSRATVLFAGDMMFDRFIRIKTEKRGGEFVFACLDDTLERADLVIANLEGPVTPFASISASSTVGTLANMTFTFPLTTADLLAQHNIRMVNLGNNHIRNFGTEGVRTTMSTLSDAGVGFFGSPLQSDAVYRHIEGVPVSFVSYNEFGGGRDVVLQQVVHARDGGFLPVVYTHWGDEYATTSAPRQRELAHAFVDAGAELVIGSHPHVIQEHEQYRGKYIYYSLGNFVFDQYWNDEVRTGLLLRITLTDRGVERVDEIHTELQPDGRTCLKTS